MPLKLLQAEQNEMINHLSNEKALVLNGKNNHKHVFKQAVKGGYTHFFTSSEIALFKKFKKNIFNDLEFTDWLCLHVVDEIYLVDQWEKAFCPLYAEIEKVWKRIPCDIPFLGRSATLTKQIQMEILNKAGFRTGYCLI